MQDRLGATGAEGLDPAHVRYKIYKPAAQALCMTMMSLEPSVVKWIVDSSGMAHADLARKLRVDTATVGSWIKTGRMEYGRIQDMARCVKRPEAIFLLKEPPEEEEIPDLRSTPGAAAALGPEDRITVRRARYAQYAAGDMMGMLGEDPRPAIGGAAGAGDPSEEVAKRETKALGLGGAGRGAGGFCGLRESIEGRNILVLQDAMDVGAVRGVALTDAMPYAILVNANDADESKAFALLHEYGHALLKRGGICNERGWAGPARTSIQRTEAWCDRFAASVLMPRDRFMEEMGALGGRERRSARAVVEGIAKKFGTSRYAAAVRAADALGGPRGRDCRRLAGAMANRFAAGAPEKAAGEKKPGVAGPADRAVTRLGRKFVGLALASYEKKAICSREFVEYLGTDPKHLGMLRQKVHGGG